MDPGPTGHHGAVVNLAAEKPETELVITQLQYLADLTVWESQERRVLTFAMESSVVQVALD